MKKYWVQAVLVWCSATMLLVGVSPAFAIFGLFESEKKAAPLPPVPHEYAGKKMPVGWWDNPEVLKAGKAIYEGELNPEVNCSKCHGLDGKPTRRGHGARDFRNPDNIDRMSDAYWFWRISEGIPKTKMRGWKKFLSEEQRWQVMAYEYSFSKGKAKPR